MQRSTWANGTHSCGKRKRVDLLACLVQQGHCALQKSLPELTTKKRYNKRSLSEVYPDSARKEVETEKVHSCFLCRVEFGSTTWHATQLAQTQGQLAWLPQDSDETKQAGKEAMRNAAEEAITPSRPGEVTGLTPLSKCTTVKNCRARISNSVVPLKARLESCDTREVCMQTCKNMWLARLCIGCMQHLTDHRSVVEVSRYTCPELEAAQICC